MSARNLELASFLKSRRHRLTPGQVGLPQNARRRLPSLRREEVAWLADVGITWYTWLEQGRPIKVAASTLGRIAAVLKLNTSESDYLRKLVLGRTSEHHPWNAPVTDRVRKLIEVYDAGPAFVVGPRWDILACNDRFEVAFVCERNETGLLHNALWRMFALPKSRVVIPDWIGVARQMVGIFRVEYADFVGDVGFEELIDRLSDESPDFVAIWADVGVLSPMLLNVREMRDPATGVISKFETVSFNVPEGDGQTAIFYYHVNEDGTASTRVG